MVIDLILKTELNEKNTPLKPLESYTVETFSQCVSLPTAEQFLEFIRESSVPPREVTAEVRCVREPRSIDPYIVTPSYCEFRSGTGRSIVELREFQPALLRDLEYVSFEKGHIAESLALVLEGLREIGFAFK